MKEYFQFNPSLAQMIVEAVKEVVGKDTAFIHLDGKALASAESD